MKNMICTECGGRGTTFYYVETDRDEYTVTLAKREGICRTCNGSGNQPMTNADRIRAMSDEELADFIQNCGCPNHARDCRRLCYDCVFEWLKEPVED